MVEWSNLHAWGAGPTGLCFFRPQPPSFFWATGSSLLSGRSEFRPGLACATHWPASIRPGRTWQAWRRPAALGTPRSPCPAPFLPACPPVEALIPPAHQLTSA
eukprot:282275-Chlamydomonas_euryale.AAC.1